ncbi:MAG: hypothetical protein EBT61_01080 [Verrucomicrobia bacterium]|nr:hypothetical protein [Verrucomicrobiota bacterium]
MAAPFPTILARCLSLILAAGSALPARAVLFYGTGDPSFNTTAPTGGLLDSGWQYQGTWGGSLGTAIAPDLFVTAKHLGGSVGDTFTYGGTTYQTTAVYDSPASDLRVWRVNGTFATYAPLYRDGSASALSQSAVVFGRGTQRGSEVTVSGQLKGWTWGTTDQVQRWGQNTVDGVTVGGASLGNLLRLGLSATGGANEAHLSSGDSGGAVFLQSGGTWKLAGINYSVDGQFSLTGVNGSGFNAAIFDARGLYFGSDGNWQLINGANPVESSFYATSISDNLSFLDALITPVPEPGVIAWLGCVACAVLFAWETRRRRLRPTP